MWKRRVSDIFAFKRFSDLTFLFLKQFRRKALVSHASLGASLQRPYSVPTASLASLQKLSETPSVASVGTFDMAAGMCSCEDFLVML